MFGNIFLNNSTHFYGAFLRNYEYNLASNVATTTTITNPSILQQNSNKMQKCEMLIALRLRILQCQMGHDATRPANTRLHSPAVVLTPSGIVCVKRRERMTPQIGVVSTLYRRLFRVQRYESMATTACTVHEFRRKKRNTNYDILSKKIEKR